MIHFMVRGVPQTQGSKRAFPFKRRDGRLGVAVTDDNPKGKAWKSQVADAATEKMNGAPLMTGMVIIEMDFYLQRPKSHYRTGKYSFAIKPSAPMRPIVKPDALKMARAVEDALTGIVWRDDSQVVEMKITKQYSDEPFVAVEVTELK